MTKGAQRATALRVFAAYYARGLTDPALAAVFLAAEQPWSGWWRI
ncbi:hypothetical protein [Streptomyces lydicus]